MIFASPVNAKPSIVNPVAVVLIVIVPVNTASAALVSVLGLIPLLGPTIVKLAIEIVIFSLYSPAANLIVSPSLAAAKASAIVA